MNLDILQSLLDWTRLHPHWAELVVFVVAFAESLAVVGLILPGVVLLFGAGALVAFGALDLWTTLAAAAAGASLGDGISFWLGHHYHQHLRVLWPMRRYPDLINRGVDFFYRHGGKSVVLGRFIGPLRPFIPAIAGMLGMPVGRYIAINLCSAVAWAPAYILPGVVFGASLDLAGEVAGRLVLLIVLLIAVLLVTLWLARRVFLFIQPHAGVYLDRALHWSLRHPLLGRLSGTLIDPQQPEARGLLVFALLLIASAWAFFHIVNAVLGASGVTPFDTVIHQLLQGLRTPWADQVFVAVTELGDVPVYIPVTMALLFWLVLRRRIAAAAHLLAAVAFGTALSEGLKYALGVPRPSGMAGLLTDPSFPSGHALISMTLYGFIAVLVARELNGPRRWLPYLCAGVLILLIAISRLYLGAHWLSDVLGGLTLGLAWVALLGIAYRRHAPPMLSVRGVIAVSALALLLAGGAHIWRQHDNDLERYAVRHEIRTVDDTFWWTDGWRELPAFREDLRGRAAQPLTLQWSDSLDAIRQRLIAHGWRNPVNLSPATALLWLSPRPQLEGLPVLPQVHDGRHEALRLVLTGAANDVLYVLRLWPADTTLAPSGRALWIGNITALRVTRTTPLFTYLHTAPAVEVSLAALRPALTGWEWREVRRGEAPGGVLLVRQGVE